MMELNVVSREHIAGNNMGIVPITHVSELRQCAILLDIDGTILDIAPTPREVWVPAPLRKTIARLQDFTGGALAMVSGRPLRDIDLIFAPLQLAAIGGHGAELRPLPGTEPQVFTGSLSAELKRNLAALTALGPGVIVEDKGYSLALHFRLAPDFGAALHAAVAEVCAQSAEDTVEVLAGKAVVEVKPNRVSKATAVRELMKYRPFAGRHPIFIGDDVTDEPVFGIIPEFGGMGFSVGRVVPGADGHFDRPEDVRSWLARIVTDRGDTTE